MILPAFVQLKPDVVEFLDSQQTVVYCLGVKSYIINNAVYTETKKPGIYVVSFNDEFKYKS